MYRDRVWQFLKKVQSIPPWPERQIEVLAQVEDVEWQPAHYEEQQGGQQQVSPPHIAPLTQHPSAQDNQGYWEYRGFYQNVDVREDHELDNKKGKEEFGLWAVSEFSKATNLTHPTHPA